MTICGLIRLQTTNICKITVIVSVNLWGCFTLYFLIISKSNEKAKTHNLLVRLGTLSNLLHCLWHWAPSPMVPPVVWFIYAFLIVFGYTQDQLFLVFSWDSLTIIPQNPSWHLQRYPSSHWDSKISAWSVSLIINPLSKLLDSCRFTVSRLID